MKKTLSALMMAATVLVAGLAFAGAATDTVKSTQQELFNVIGQPQSAERETKLKSLFDQILAYDQFAKDSLGDKWDSLDADQKTKFSSRLTTLVRCNYKRNLKNLLNYDIVYAGEEAKRGGTLVKTRARHKKDKREPEIEIDFLMMSKGGSQKAIDIYTERASLTKTYKSQFLRILKKEDGFNKLIEKMDSKIKKDGCS